MLKNKTEMRAANRAAGQTWFEKPEMDFFNITIHWVKPTHDGALFVTSDYTEDPSDRMYSVCFCHDSGWVYIMGDFRKWNNPMAAKHRMLAHYYEGDYILDSE